MTRAGLGANVSHVNAAHCIFNDQWLYFVPLYWASSSSSPRLPPCPPPLSWQAYNSRTSGGRLCSSLSSSSPWILQNTWATSCSSPTLSSGSRFPRGSVNASPGSSGEGKMENLWQMEISVFWEIRILLLWDLFLKYGVIKGLLGLEGCKSEALDSSLPLIVLILLLFLYCFFVYKMGVTLA